MTVMKMDASALAESRKGWRKTLPVHPAAEVFPIASPEELKQLAASIKAVGLQQRIIVWDLETDDGPVAYLDGRNRPVVPAGAVVSKRRGTVGTFLRYGGEAGATKASPIMVAITEASKNFLILEPSLVV